jgi:GntR family transcriptional regulator/MocR family aminotransferase
MHPLSLAIDHSKSASLPLFLQVARGLAEAVRQGRLRPGERLPGTRSVAEWLGVHRNTVLAAWDELAAEGWITTSPARGTFVSRALPETRPRAFAQLASAQPARLGFDLGAGPPPYRVAPAPRGTLALRGGLPDLRLSPAVELGRAYRRVLARRGPTLLGYGDPRGHERLRQALAELLTRTRGLTITHEHVVVTRGSQMALDLIARTMLAPGDRVAIEALGYPPAWQALGSTGATLLPIGVDAEGLRVDRLGELCARERVRAVYLTPHHHYPTTVTLSAPRRLALLELARRHRLAILEDDYDHEFHYEGRPILPLFSADAAGVVIYVGTLSKVLAPGLRMGYLVAPEPFCTRLAAHRAYVDMSGDAALEVAVADLFESGEVERHIRRARRIYRARRDALCQALARDLGAVASFRPPSGGMALWCRLRGVDADRVTERAAERGVVVQPGRRFAFAGGARPYLRLGFAALDESEISVAVRRLAAAVRHTL